MLAGGADERHVPARIDARAGACRNDPLVRTILRAAAVVAALGVTLPASAGAATLVVGTSSDPDSIDPAVAYAPESWQMLVNAGEGLVAYRPAAGLAGADIVPALAAAMPAVSPDGRRLVFTLRADARFGPPADRPVRPSDVKASIERLFLVGSPGRGLFRTIRGAARFEAARTGGIAGIIANDGTGRLRIALTRSDPGILHALALPFAFALPRETPAVEQTAPIASAGPYRISAYTRGALLELVRNSGYAPGATGSATPGPDRIQVRIGLSTADAVRLAGEGRIDYVQARASSADAAAAGAGGSQARVHRHVEGAIYYFFMNTRRAPFDDARVRRAVDIAIDRAALARAFGAQAVPTTQVLPPGVPGRLRVASAPAPDIARARRLVAQAGATGAAVDVWGWTGEPSPALTRGLERTLERIGLRPRSRLWERSTMLAALADPDAGSQIGFARWRQDYPDAADWYPLLLSGSAIRRGSNLNYALLADAGVDRLIARAAATWDPRRRAIRWAAVGRAVEARVPWAPFANTVQVDITSQRVGGYVAHPLYGFLWMRARL